MENNSYRNYIMIQKHVNNILTSGLCPICHEKNDAWDMCDNDCGSLECTKCGKEFCVNSKGIIKLGHNEKCGDSEDYE